MCVISNDTTNDIGRTDREQIRSRINNDDCRTFRQRRPLSTGTEAFVNCVQNTVRS